MAASWRLPGEKRAGSHQNMEWRAHSSPPLKGPDRKQAHSPSGEGTTNQGLSSPWSSSQPQKGPTAPPTTRGHEVLC